MNILILGGTGFLGSYLSYALNEVHQVDFTYSKNTISKGIQYSIGDDLISKISCNKYDIVINNINPLNLSYRQLVAFTEDLILLCNRSNAKIIQISSVFASFRNRFENSYNVKKAISEDIIRTELSEEKYCILRLPQLFDGKGLFRISQPGLFYLLKQIKSNGPISLFANYKECLRNYMPLEIVVQMILVVINKNFKGVINAHLDEFTLSLEQLVYQSSYLLLCTRHHRFLLLPFLQLHPFVITVCIIHKHQRVLKSQKPSMKAII